MASGLTSASLLGAHAALMHEQHHASPGRWRQAAVWIGSHAPTPHTAAFVPPRPSRIDASIQDLLVLCERTDLPVLARTAVAHAQFETIHPFADGNGRTGRVLVHALLQRAGAAQRLTIPVSAGLLSDTESCFQALGAYGEGDCAPRLDAAAHPAAAQRAIDHLVQAGVLTPASANRHNRVWIATEITRTVDDVMASARRRR